jgi:ribonuclease P protein component
MIGKAFRFHGHGSLRYVYTNGKTVRGPLCSLKYAVNPKRDSYRLAVVVSKKVSKSAVVRNRIRRRLYEAVRLQAPQLQQSVDMVISVFSDQLLELPADQVTRLVRAQLKQAGLLL